MRYVLIAALAMLAAGCASEGATPYTGPPLVLSTYQLPTASPAPVYRPGIMCQTMGTYTFCN